METTYDSQIEQIVQSIFSSMLRIEVVRAEATAYGQDELLGTIQIAGVKAMSVALTVPKSVAQAAAVAMLQIPAPELSETDEKDVVAELVNMIGGNLKSLLPGPLYLSLPTVVAGCELGLQVPGAELVDDVWLQCESGPLRVRLYSQLVEA
jgi:chemotaxis protein CheX